MSIFRSLAGGEEKRAPARGLDSGSEFVSIDNEPRCSDVDVLLVLGVREEFDVIP